jgi:hypothetical protein
MIKHLPDVLLKEKTYYMRCWVNLFDKGKNIDWHSHWQPHFKTYHGFYCVNTEGEHPSHTDYKIPNVADIITIPSYDGLCVIGKSEGDGHRSSEWLNDGKYRVTIAFDIIPVELLKSDEKFIYLEVNKEVQNKFWDHYANKQYFKTKREDIRETFNQLYRDIQLQQILR